MRDRIVVIEEVEVQTVAIVTEGPQGSRGPAGENGLPGADGEQGPPGAAVNTYVHTQVSPAATWTILHNLGTKPSVVFELTDNPTENVYTDVFYPDLNTAVVEWAVPETGKAFL